jgi:alkylmercury lyase
MDPDCFAAAYRARVTAARDGLALWSAVVRLTNLGQRPVSLADLAAALHRTVPATQDLVDRWGNTLKVHHGHVEHEHPSGPSPATRWRMTVGERAVFSEAGCAPDLYAIAAWIDQPIRVESTCPATATSIRVDISPHGVTHVEPPGTVVAVLDPNGPKFPGGETDDICAQQRFFASPQAGAAFLAHHPTSQLIPATQFWQWARYVGLLWPAVDRDQPGPVR